jgi:hypothetical protein
MIDETDRDLRGRYVERARPDRQDGKERRDARFPHGRALNAFAWRQDAAGTHCRYSLADIGADLTLARDLYSKSPDRPTDAVAVLSNDLAFIHCVDSRDGAYSIEIAPKYLTDLESILPESSWDPEYPEYFHTKALVEMGRFLAARSNDDDRVPRRHLEEARRLARMAEKLSPEPAYKDLVQRLSRQ